MKSSMKLSNLLVPLFAISIFASGCYTQLATTRDEGQSLDGSTYDESRAYGEADTLAPRGLSDYDEGVSGHFRSGFDFYYPSSWYWSLGYGDPYSYGFGYPGYYGSPYGYYGYGYGHSYYGYGYNPYYGGFNPYYTYGGYPFVTYGVGGARNNQTRDAGYRRSGFTRNSGLSGGVRASVSSSLGVSPASRRSSSPGGGTVAPTNRRSGTTESSGNKELFAAVLKSRPKCSRTESTVSSERQEFAFRRESSSFKQ
jgi:hypothetical protein